MICKRNSSIVMQMHLYLHRETHSFAFTAALFVWTAYIYLLKVCNNILFTNWQCAFVCMVSFFFFNFSSACFFSFLYNRDSIDSLLLAIRGGVVWLGERIHQLQSNISINKCLQTTLSFDLHHIIVYTIQAFYLTVLPLFLYSLHCRPVSLTPCRQLHPPTHLSLSLISSNCALGAAMQY